MKYARKITNSRKNLTGKQIGEQKLTCLNLNTSVICNSPIMEMNKTKKVSEIRKDKD